MVGGVQGVGLGVGWILESFREKPTVKTTKKLFFMKRFKIQYFSSPLFQIDRLIFSEN